MVARLLSTQAPVCGWLSPVGRKRVWEPGWEVILSELLQRDGSDSRLEDEFEELRRSEHWYKK